MMSQPATSSSPSLVSVIGLRGLPDVMGGIETHCQGLYPALGTALPEIRFCLYARSPYVGHDGYRYHGIEIKPLWALKRKGVEAFLHTLLGVMHAALLQRPGVLHFHAIGPALLVPLARLAGLRVLSTHHGHDYRRAKWGPLAKFMLRAGEWLMVRYSHEVICVSDSDAAHLRQTYPSRQRHIHAIPNGVVMPPPADSAAVLAGLGLADGRYVLAVGRLVPEKGFHDLIAAHRQAATGQRLVIVGAADHEDSYSRQLRAAADNDVVFAGARSKHELRVLYQHASVFVLPSYHEGLPLVALEAMFCGAPTLLSDIPANRQIGLPSDRYFAPGDVVGLATKLTLAAHEQVRPDPDLLLRYRWDDIAKKTATVLLAAAGSAH